MSGTIFAHNFYSNNLPGSAAKPGSRTSWRELDMCQWVRKHKGGM